MDLQWLEALIQPVVFSSLSAIPFILQIAKGVIPGFSVKVASFVSLAAVIGLVLGVARPQLPELSWIGTVGQIVLSWVYVELLFVKVVGPTGESANPIIPETLKENKDAPKRSHH